MCVIYVIKENTSLHLQKQYSVKDAQEDVLCKKCS